MSARKPSPPLDADNGESPFLFTPTDGDQGVRIDRFLAERMTEWSRTRIQAFIAQGRVCRSGEVILNSNYKIRHWDPIQVLPPTPLASSIAPEDLPIRILYEDDSIAIVVKPSGMPTHPTTTRTTGTLVNALLFHLSNLSDIGGVLRPGIVHRLDRVTSGVLTVAKNQHAHQSLSNQFKARTVKKTYRALCLGGDPGDEGKVEGKIQRHPVKRQRMVLGTTGRDSLSTYKRLQSRGKLQGFFFYPHTGRTHQIRIHLESLKCPVVLDELYGYQPKNWPIPSFNPLLRDYPGILLHAERLEFDHPETGQRMSFRQSPPGLFCEVWQAAFDEVLDRDSSK